jgi:hypothetical protein
MAKGQSVIIQFLIFFLIGFAVFLSIGTFFRYQSDIFRQSILSLGVNLTNSYLSSAVIVLVDSCKECDYAGLMIRTQNTSAGYPIIVSMDSQLKTLNTSAPPSTATLNTTIHNLLKNLAVSGSSSSTKAINLTFSRTYNNLTVKRLNE